MCCMIYILLVINIISSPIRMGILYNELMRNDIGGRLVVELAKTNSFVLKTIIELDSDIDIV